MLLGAIIFMSFFPALLFRGALERRLVLSAPAMRRSARQFGLDFILCLAAGLFSGLWVVGVSGFPVMSGARLFLGAAAGGFFMGLDMALTRERTEILEAERRGGPWTAPERIVPMTRKFVLVAVAIPTITAVIMGMLLTNDVNRLFTAGGGADVLGAAKAAIIRELYFVMAVAVALIVRVVLLYTGNLRLLFNSQTSVLERVSRGDLSRRAPVATADEFGFIAGRTNAMIDGLTHRMELLDALKTAEEVQRNLLPAAPPEIPGLDIAAESRSCDEIGGDYYDFIPQENGHVGLAVGDVAGHGVGPALLMASARAYLRMAVRRKMTPEAAVGAVNRLLAEDVYGTGRFLTLFFLDLDPKGEAYCWVRAGHDPALVYDPASDAFCELTGRGVPLGVLPDAEYGLGECAAWPCGGVLCLGTDGIWETRGPGREMFGKERLKEVLRANADRSARQIVAAVFAALEDFRAGRPIEDDVTMALVKFPAKP